MKIYEILDSIDKYQLFVPAFQREYVWKRKDAKNLIDSLIKDYPTGTMLTWTTNDPPELKGKHKYDSRQGSVKIILDGQQRITTLYMLMRGEIPPYYELEEITNDIRGLRVNVETLELEYYKKTIMENDPSWVDITEIFKSNIRFRDVTNKLEELQDGERLDKEREENIYENFLSIEKIKDREFKEQIIPTKANIKEAIDIFYIVNAAGVNLTDAELALAQISGYWPEAREMFKKKLKELEKNGFVFKLDFIIYVLLGIIHSQGSKMEKLHDKENLDKVKDTWKELDEYVLDYVLNVMKSQAFIDHTKEINSVFALVPIIVYTFNKKRDKLNDEEIKKIVKWFYYSQIRARYVSQLSSKLDKDIGIVVNEDNPFDKLLNIIKLERPLEISPDEFIGRGIQHPLWGLMTWYFKSKNAICFSTGVSIRKNMGKKFELEWDHIFPWSALRDRGYNRNNSTKYALAQEITNRAILTQTANRTKLNKPAEGYLKEVNDKFPKAQTLQCIPQNEVLWKIENFEDFLQERRKILAKELNDFLENITITEEVNVEEDILEMIENGENNGVEFKTTLRYDMNTLVINKKLEEVILKTIAAFSNADGGTLIMGVEDNGNVVGLGNDYNTLKGGTKDEFENHLRNLIRKEYGTDFDKICIEINFPRIEDEEICIVEISPFSKPLYTVVSNNSGVKTKKFYVRSGNSSPELDISEVSEYINKRF